MNEKLLQKKVINMFTVRVNLKNIELQDAFQKKNGVKNGWLILMGILYENDMISLIVR
ncbi:hypothetical protein J6V86_01700 [bacterium]|nr:hypothetical protein [bacterium]